MIPSTPDELMAKAEKAVDRVANADGWSCDWASMQLEAAKVYLKLAELKAAILEFAEEDDDFNVSLN